MTTDARFVILDERNVWHGPAVKAAQARGYSAARIRRGHEAEGPGLGFIRPHANPHVLRQNQTDYDQMRRVLTMAQDEAQVRLYENKTEQFRRWGAWMPSTWVFGHQRDALRFLETPGAPERIVSKANEGASSVNVRVLLDRDAQRKHIQEVFTRGIRVNCCADGAAVTQRDYVLLQEYIPHLITWRVNIVGRHMAVFERYCYENGLVAETGNTLPVTQMTPQLESLLDYASKFFAAANTRWCAIDVLKHGSGWKLLETSLAWPWPSPGRCDESVFWGTKRVWAEMWELLLDEYEAGVWASK